MTRDLRLDCDLRGRTAEVVIEGELDMAAAFKLEPAIDQVVSENRVDELVFDLGISARVARPSQAVERVLEASGTRSVLLD